MGVTSFQLGLAVASLAGCIAAAVAFAPVVKAQGSGTGLMVVVSPEAHLDPPQVNLTFLVDALGQAAQAPPVTVKTWVRALPNQRIVLNAKAADLSGTAGVIPYSALRWNGSVLQATAGGQAANCSSGGFAGGPAQGLIANWQLSGTLTCSLVFSLDFGQVATAPAPGAYTGSVELSLFAQ